MTVLTSHALDKEMAGIVLPGSKHTFVSGKQLDFERFDCASTSVIKAKRLLNVMLVCTMIIYGTGVQHRALEKNG